MLTTLPKPYFDVLFRVSQKYGYTDFVMDKDKNETQDTFLGNKSKIISHNFIFVRFPKMGLLGLARNLKWLDP